MSFNHWKQHFISNRSHFNDLDLTATDQLTEKEKNTICFSLQQFQRGENSEGKHLFSFAKEFSDPSYLECIKLFIPEEQVHARVLGAFMKKHSIPLIKGHWVDGVFRWLRKLGGIANTVRVLLVAEIIAKVYYKALHNATGSALLKKICNQILLDEEQHIRFQCEALSIFYQQKSAAYRFLVQYWQLILMTGTIIVVWVHHRKVLKAGSYSFSRFFRETLMVFFAAERSIYSKHMLSQDEASMIT